MKQVRRVALSMTALTVALGALAGVAVAKPASKPPKSNGPGKPKAGRRVNSTPPSGSAAR